MSVALTNKTRRHSGRITPRLRIKGNKENIINDCLEPQVFWDDWKNYRDGQRGSGDRKLLRNPYVKVSGYFDIKRWNVKLKKLILRRQLRKNSKM